MFIVYVLYSASFNKIYIGYTSHLDEGMLSHNSLSKKGYTLKFRPWSLVYTEKFIAKADAMRREKELKSAKGRTFILKLIEH